MKFFQYGFPIDPSSMTRWRNRIGEAGAEELLKEPIETGLKLKAVKPSQLARGELYTIPGEEHFQDRFNLFFRDD